MQCFSFGHLLNDYFNFSVCRSWLLKPSLEKMRQLSSHQRQQGLLEGTLAFVLPHQDPVSRSKERSLCASCRVGIALINSLKPALLRDADICYASLFFQILLT